MAFGFCWRIAGVVALAGALVAAGNAWAGRPGPAAKFRAYRASDPATWHYYYQAYPGPGAVPYPNVHAHSGPRPWFGQAMGAPTFNYGYFGAQRHAQYWSHTGYYGEYHECGYSKDY